MKFLIFLFIVSNINLVLTEDVVAKEKALTQQDSYKIYPERESVPPNDQIAESSHSAVEAYKMMNKNQIQIPVEKLNGADVRQENAQQEVFLQENLRQNIIALNNNEILQPALTHGYGQQQQISVQQYPLQAIEILGAEASPFHQTNEDGHKTLGYSSYIEHVSEKEEEEIKSALKKGSVNDIKRLVPKSGISFKIYQNDKNPDNQKTHLRSKASADYSQNSKLQYSTKTAAPVTQFRIRTAYQENQQPTPGLGVQHVFIKTDVGKPQLGYENSQLQSVRDVSLSQDQKGSIDETHYYSQQPFIINHSDENSQKSALKTNDRNSFLVNSQFKINVEDNNYSKANAEFSSLTEKGGSKHGLTDISNLQYQKQWKFDSKDSTQKAVKNIIPPATLQYDRNLAVHNEKTRPLHYIQNQGLDIQNNISKYKKPKSYAETPKSQVNANYFLNSYAANTNQNSFVEHLADKAYLDKESAHNVINRILGNHLNTESVKIGENQIIGHFDPSANAQSLKNVQSDRFASNPYPDSETAKSSQHDLISHIAKNSYTETKSNQNNFDHQKALEGSTSFDIKNAIDSTGNLIHQANYQSPAKAHPVEDIHQQHLAYIIPKIPTSAVSLDDSDHDASIGEGHQIKDIGQAVITSPHLSYHPVSSPEASGKFFHQPQTIVWTSEDLKQGNALTANDFHQSLISLHLPKEEIYQHSAKIPSVELPTSSVSHISYQHQKQPYFLHYEVPLLKHPQEIHFQPKTKTRLQNNQAGHIKLTQPITIDWSLLKTTLPNFNIKSLPVKPELTSHFQETGKKIVPILVRKRKNRSNNRQEIGVVYGKVNGNRRPTKPTHRHEKNARVNLHSEASNNVKQYEENGDRKNEFSVSAYYKVDRSLKSPNNS